MGKKKKRKTKKTCDRCVHLGELNGVEAQVEKFPATSAIEGGDSDLPPVESVPETTPEPRRRLAYMVLAVWAFLVLVTAVGIISGRAVWDDLSELIASVNLLVGGVLGYYFKG